MMAALMIALGILGSGLAYLAKKVWKKKASQGLLANLFFPFAAKRRIVGLQYFNSDYFLWMMFLPIGMVVSLGINLFLLSWQGVGPENFVAYWEKQGKAAQKQLSLDRAKDELDSCERRLRQLVDREHLFNITASRACRRQRRSAGAIHVC